MIVIKCQGAFLERYSMAPGGLTVNCITLTARCNQRPRAWSGAMPIRRGRQPRVVGHHPALMSPLNKMFITTNLAGMTWAVSGTMGRDAGLKAWRPRACGHRPAVHLSARTNWPVPLAFSGEDLGYQVQDHHENGGTVQFDDTRKLGHDSPSSRGLAREQLWPYFTC